MHFYHQPLGRPITIEFALDNDCPQPVPPTWPGESTGSDDLTLVHGFPSLPPRPAVLPIKKDGKVVGLKLDRLAAAKLFVRERLIRYRGKSRSRQLFELGRINFQESEEVDEVLISWCEIDESRVRERIEDFLFGLELAAAQIGSLLAGDVDRVRQIADSIPCLPWGSSGNPESDTPHLGFVRRYLCAIDREEADRGITRDELLDHFCRVTSDEAPQPGTFAENQLKKDLKIAIEVAFAHLSSVRYTDHLRRRQNDAQGNYIRTRRAHGWLGLKFWTPAYSWGASPVPND